MYAALISIGIALCVIGVTLVAVGLWLVRALVAQSKREAEYQSKESGL